MLKVKRNLGILIAHLENTDTSKPFIIANDTPNAICKIVLNYKAVPKIKWIHQKGKKLVTQNLTKADVKTDVLNRVKLGGLTTKEKVSLYEIFKVKLPENLQQNATKCKTVKKAATKKKAAGTKRKVRK